MPRIDPITGCEVMTFMEFISEEGKRAGSSPCDIMSDIAMEIAEENSRMEEEYRKPEIVFEAIKQHTDVEYEDWEAGAIYDREEGITPDLPPIQPERVLEVLNSECSFNYNKTHILTLARVLCIDGNERIAEFSYTYWPGSRMDPPEEDSELSWHDSLESYKSFVDQKKEN